VPDPEANFSATPATGCAPLIITAIDGSTDTRPAVPATYAWNFGDGTWITGKPPISHTYLTGGTDSVTLAMTDNYGCTDTLTRHDYIHVHQPIAGFYVDDTVICQETGLTFHD